MTLTICPQCQDTDCHACTGNGCECSCECGHPCNACGYAGPGLCPCDLGQDLIREK